MENKSKKKPCPVAKTLSLIGGRWKTVILYQLSDHTRRFGELTVRIPPISRKVLSDQLKELETDGLINRQEFKEMPPRVEYSLTDLGNSVKPILESMATWGNEVLLSANSNQTNN